MSSPYPESRSACRSTIAHPSYERNTDRRIRLVCKDSNRGIPCTPNHLPELARAPYIAWLDSDDRMAQRLLWRHVIRRAPEFGQKSRHLQPNATNFSARQAKPLRRLID